MTQDPQDLLFETAFPPQPREGAPVAVLLHGRGADRYDLLELARNLPEGTLVVTPQAPFSGTEWGYGGGWAWYRYLSGDHVVTETLVQSLDLLDRFMDTLADRLPVSPGPVFVGGFSQGGTLSLAWALRRAARGETPPPILNLSGFLVDDAEVSREGASRIRIFWGHGIQDPAIPHALGRKGRVALELGGAQVVAMDHRGGHWVDPEEMAAAVRWMEERMKEG
jgi:phospholipase/carboxylesterase